MPLWQNVSGVWKNISPFHNVSGVWKAGVILWNNVSGVWKVITRIWSPAGGVVSDSQFGTSASVTLTCAVPATWTYTLAGGGSPGGSVNQASGYVGLSITFTQTPGASGVLRSNSWTVQGNVSGFPTENWTVNLDAENP